MVRAVDRHADEPRLFMRERRARRYARKRQSYLPLNNDAPAWVEVQVSSNPATSDLNDISRYTDGRPTSSHTYYSQQFIERRDRNVRFGALSTSPSGFGDPAVDGFSILTNTWDARRTFPDLPMMANPGLATCKNPTTEDVYVHNYNADYRKWTEASNSWSIVSAGIPPITGQESASAYDTTRNRIFLLRDTAEHHTFDPATGAYTEQTLSGAAASTVAATGVLSLGMIYHPVLDAYLVRMGRSTGGAVYSINASTFAVTALSTTGGTSIPATANISGSPENVFTKWLYAPSLQGCIFIPAYAANAWFFRTH